MRTSDLSEAKQALTEWYYANHVAADSDPDDVSVKLLLWRYYTEYAVSEIRSVEQARIACQRLVDFFATEPVATLSIHRQEAYVAWRRASVSDSTISRELSVLRAAIKRAYKRGELRAPPFIMDVEKAPARDRLVTPQEVAEILATAKDERLWRFIMIGMNTLARPESVPELTMFQVSFRDRLINFNAVGRKQTKKYRPSVPISRTLLPILEARRGEQAAVGLALKTIRRKWRVMVKEIGLADVLPRDLFRHTMATELRRRGVSMEEISGMLGHKQYGTSEVYAKYAPDFRGPAIEAIDAYFADLPSSFRQVENR